MSRNRWCLGLAGVLILASGLALARGRAPDPRPAEAKAGVGRAGVLPAPTGVSAGGAVPGTAAAASAKVGVASRPVTVRYTFDGGITRPITDLNGTHELHPILQNGGLLRLVPQKVGGLALAYPSRCRLARERDCPRAILEGVRDDGLNPGTRSLTYGAAVRMTQADLADGANVLQKGYSVGGVSQFKLQVDHERGHPSCVITGTQRRIYRAEPWLDVADGKWHELVCARTTDRLTMSVDGVERAGVALPPALSIANTEPLRIGGKGAGKGNDQFAGEIDNVFLTIGS